MENKKRKKVYYTGNPMYVSEENIKNVDFIGDWIGFAVCNDIYNCRVFRSKKVEKKITIGFCVSRNKKPEYSSFFNCIGMNACSVIDETFFQRIARFFRNIFIKEV